MSERNRVEQMCGRKSRTRLWVAFRGCQRRHYRVQEENSKGASLLGQTRLLTRGFNPPAN
jgi:hypothetical protein